MRLALLALMFSLCVAGGSWAADEKIDPADYICAELTAANTSGQPPIYEGLQIDGFYSAQMGIPYADPSILAPLLIEVSDSCSSQPADRVLSHWGKAREKLEAAEGILNVKTYKCADYSANPDDGSGFVIWLDAYNRAEKGKKASVLSSQEAIDGFLEACKADPDKLMIEIIDKMAK